MSKALKFAAFTVAVASLNLKAGTQFRAHLNDEAIKDYTDLVKAAQADAKDKDKEFKNPFPRIKVVRTPDKGDVVVDGFQRTNAFKKAKLEEVEVDLAEGTLDQARRYALTEVNLQHGVRLTNEDHLNRLNAALEIPELAELSNNALAKQLGRSEFWIRTHRPMDKTPKEVKTAKGTTVKTGRIGKGKGKADEGEQPELPGAEGAQQEGGAEPDLDLGASVDNESGKGTGGAAPNADERQAKKAEFDDETERALNKIVGAIDGKGFEGEKVRADIRSGKVKLSAKAVREWSASSPGRILLAAPLILHCDYTPARAYGLIDAVPDLNTKVASLVDLAVARQGVAQEKIEGYHVLVVNSDAFKVTRNHALGVFALVPKGSNVMISEDPSAAG